MAGTHQIAAQILPGTHQIAQRLLPQTRNRDRMQLTRGQQPHQALGVTAIGLDAITRPARDQPRRTHHTLDPGRRQPPRQHKTRRPGLIGRPHRARQLPRELRDVVAATRQPPHPQLTRIALQDRGHHATDVHIKRRPGLSLRHVGTPMIAVGAQANSWTLNPRTSCAGADPHIYPGRSVRPAIWSSAAGSARRAR